MCHRIKLNFLKADCGNQFIIKLIKNCLKKNKKERKIKAFKFWTSTPKVDMHNYLKVNAWTMSNGMKQEGGQ